MLKFGFFILICSASGLELPDYIGKCDPSDKEFNDCVVKQANDAIPTIVNGDAKYKLINMSPLKIPLVDLSPGPNLEMRLSDLVVKNLKNVRLSKANFDLKSKKLSFYVDYPVLEVLSKYFIKGQILVLPITGEGNSNITLVKNKIVYDSDLDVKTVDKEEYYFIGKADVKVIPERVYFHLDNLFGGDPNLGSQMNKFLDDNWQDFFQELKPAIQKTIEAVVTATLNAYFNKIPISKLFK